MTDSKAAARAAIITGIGLALFLPLFTLILPSAGLHQDDFTRAAKLDAFVRHHWAFFAAPYIDGLILHLAGVVAVLAVYRRLADRSSWVAVATIAGLAWMVLDIAQNGIGLYASHEIVQHVSAEAAGPQLVLVGQVATGLRLAGHVFGGLWVLVVSAVAIRQGGLSRRLGGLGAAAGLLMAFNVVVPPTQYPIFVLLPVWFLWLGFELRNPVDETKVVLANVPEPMRSTR
jgi:hypothetical protein